jgi:hypothetical protein
MRLTTEQSYALLEKFGVYVNEVCDSCSKILGPVRYTRRNETGVWCSRKCRGDVERPAVRGLVQRKHATLEDRVAGRRAKAAARQERLRLRKTGLQLAQNQQDTCVTFGLSRTKPLKPGIGP